MNSTMHICSVPLYFLNILLSLKINNDKGTKTNTIGRLIVFYPQNYPCGYATGHRLFILFMVTIYL